MENTSIASSTDSSPASNSESGEVSVASERSGNDTSAQPHTQQPHIHVQNINEQTSQDQEFALLYEAGKQQDLGDAQTIEGQASQINSMADVLNNQVRRQHSDQISKQFDFSPLVAAMDAQPGANIAVLLKLSEASAGRMVAMVSDNVEIGFDGARGLVHVEGSKQDVAAFLGEVYFFANPNALKHFHIDVKIVPSSGQDGFQFIQSANADTLDAASSTRVFMLYEPSSGFYVAYQGNGSRGAVPVTSELVNVVTPDGTRLEIFDREFFDVVNGLGAPLLGNAIAEAANTVEPTEVQRPAAIEDNTLVVQSGEPNVAPTAEDDSYTTAKNTALVIDARNATDGLLDNDTDPNNDTLIVSDFATTSQQGGTITDNGDGTYSYTPAAGFDGNDSFIYQITDGAGGTSDATVNIFVTNATPINTLPAAQTLLEEGTLTLSTGNGNLISIADADNDNPMSVTLNVAQGSITLNGLAGLAVTGGANNSNAVTVEGSLADINAALDGLQYTPSAHYTGAETLTITTSDGGTNDTDTLALTINNVNDAPLAVADSYSIAEDGSLVVNAASGVLNNDSDPNDVVANTLSATLVGNVANGGLVLNADGSFTYTPNGDFTGADSFTYRITDDGGTANGGTDTGNIVTVSLNVTAVNDAPVVANGAVTIAEDAANSSAAGNVTATDVDAGDTLSYAITAGNASGAFAINAGTGAITVADTTQLDFENAATITLTVSATDDGTGTLSDTGSFTVTLTDANDAPVVTNGTATIAEDAANSSAVGNVTVTDQDAGDTLTYAITAGNASGAFAINAGTGAITVADTTQLDFENAATITLTVSATDDGTGTLSDTGTFTVTLTDANDAPVVNNQALSVSENAANSAAVGTVIATDQDAGDTLSYAITAGNADGMFAINAGTGAITIADNTNLDHEVTPARALTVQVTDNGTGTLSNTGTVTVNVTDANDAPIATNGAANVSESAANGSAIGTFNVTDQDAGDTLTYAITAGNASGAFAINAGTGAITMADNSVLDFESGTTNYALTISATDDGTGNLSDTGTFTITITDGNDAPTAVTINSNNVDENSAVNTLIGTLSSTDQDAGDTHSYSIVSDPDSKFVLAGGNELRVNGVLNHEINASHTVTIRTNDGTATYDEILTILINDINDVPVYGNQTFAINEDAANSLVVGTATAADQDGDTLAYSIVGGNTDNIFAVNGASGAITVADNTNLNFESDNQYILEIQADDGNGGTNNAFITVNINNVNDAPVITNGAATIAEDEANLNAVGTIAASDDDVGDTLTYAITAGNASGAFALNTTTGAITVADNNALNFEGTNPIVLTVTATDDGTGTLVGTGTFTVTLTDVNDAPVVNDQTFSINENSTNASVVGTVLASDEDVGDTLTYAITAGNADGMFAIAANGQVTIADNTNLNHEGAASRTLTVQVTDDGTGTLSDTATITVNINDLNEAPIMNNQTMNVLDTANNGDVIGMLAATDEDVSDTLTYAITAGNGAGIFGINTTNGNITVANSGLLNSAPPYNLTVSVIDNGTGLLSDTATLTVTVNEVNDPPVLNDQTFSIDENNANGSLAAALAFSDPEGHALAFTITAGNGAGIFTINASGQITIANNANLNHELAASHTLTVRVDETSTVELLNDTATITININDLNETPVYNDATFNVNENVANSTLVGTAAATDVDAGQTLTYVITAGNTDSIFAIDASGNITVADNSNLNFESDSQYVLTVSATDDGTGTLSDTATVTIDINDLNEAPVNTVPAAQATNEDVTLDITGISVADEDAATTLTTTLQVTNGTLTVLDNVVGGVAAGDITGNGTGTITFTGVTAAAINTTLAAANALAYAPTVNYFGGDTLQISSSDGALTDTDNVAITVNSINDVPEAVETIPAQGFESNDASWTYTFNNTLFSDVENDPLTYTAQISSDNGTTYTALPAWLAFNAATRTFSLTGAPGVPNEGGYLVQINADDSNGGIGQYAFAVAVQEVGTDGSNGNDTIPATPDADALVAGDGNDSIIALGGNDTVYGGDGNDTLRGDKTATSQPGTDVYGDDLLFGGDGNDSLYGDRNNSGANGNDTLYGDAGNDRLYGLAADDLMFGGTGLDTLYGDNGNDTGHGGDGNDQFYGGNGNDEAHGDAGNDLLSGQGGNDSLLGGDGNDTLFGGTGLDTLSGGAGADQFRYDSLNESPDIITFDTIEQFDAAEDVIRVPIFDNIVAGAGNASDRTLEFFQTGTGATAKTIVQSDGVDYQFYLEIIGHHTLTNANFDYFGLIGGPGDETFNGTGGADAILSGGGNDTINGNNGNDQIFAGSGDDSISGGNNNDTIFGEDGNDSITGNGGNDTIHGGLGDDTIRPDTSTYGDGGNDTFLIDTHLNWQRGSTIHDFTRGEDVISLQGVGISGFYFGNQDRSRFEEIRLVYEAGNDRTLVQTNVLFNNSTYHFYLSGNYTTGANQLTSADFVFGNNLEDNGTEDADAAANVIRPNTAIDGVIGTDGNDTIIGGEAGRNLYINAGGGDDLIIYKDGADNNNNIAMGYGNDIVLITHPTVNSRTWVQGSANGTADSNFIVTSGNSRVVASSPWIDGNDTIFGAGQNDRIDGDNGNDILWGRHGTDTLYGENGNDFIHGGAGNEGVLSGGANDDTIIGGYGQDDMRGGNWGNNNGAGADTFIIYDPNESLTANPDYIWDFGGDDTLILHGFTGIGAGATELTVTQYTETKFGELNGSWTRIEASNADIDFHLEFLGHITFTPGGNLQLNTATIGTSGDDNTTHTGAAEFLIGQAGHDTMDGAGGNDTIFGGIGEDVLTGGTGDDSLEGGAGADTLTGSAGADTLIGDEGNDVFQFAVTDSDNTNTDIIMDFDLRVENDRIDLSDASFDAADLVDGTTSYADFTIVQPDQNGTAYTHIQHNHSSFEIHLLGYFEDGFNIDATHFIF